MPAATSSCSSAWTAGGSTPCTRRPPRRCARPRTSGRRRSQGAQGQALDTTHALGLALAAGPERWTAMEGGFPILVDGECVGGIGVSGGRLGDRRAHRARGGRVDRRELEVSVDPLRVACIGMGWWSDVLADAIKRSGKLEHRRLLHALGGEAGEVCGEVRLQGGAELRGDPRGPLDRGDHQHDAEQRRTSRRRGPRRAAGKHVFLDKPIANTIADARAITAACRKARRGARPRLPAAPREPVPLDPQADRRRRVRQPRQRARRTSAATAWARSTSARGATPPRACPAA